MGFLPGDLQSKVDPYLRPLYDALFDMLGAETYQKYLERGNIEVAPLAYMRGRTLDDSFIILDEAQNTTREQIKMFLTRLGFGSKIVVTGDATQIDLPDGKASGLKEAMRVLRDVEGIPFQAGVMFAFAAILVAARGFFIIFTRSSGLVVCTETLMGLMRILMMRSMSSSFRLVMVTKFPNKKESRSSSSLK